MTTPTRLWVKIARFLEALEGMDDPMENHLFSLEKRIEKIEHDLDCLEAQQRLRSGGALPGYATAEPIVRSL